MLPQPQDLKYFIEVSKTLNLTRASERLGITQPSLTLAIQRLEHAVGAPLLIRSKKGVVLTQAGQILFTQAQTLTDAWEKLKEKTLRSYMDVAGQYTIGCHPSVALYSLPHFMGDLLENYPHLEIKCIHDLSRKITEGVINEEGKVEALVARNENNVQVISSDTASKITSMLVKVVEEGFGKKAKIPGYYIAGKTGTAQIPWSALGISRKGYSDKTNQSFIGYAPAYNPKFMILVSLKNPNTGTAEYSAIPMFHDLAKYIIDYYQIPPDYKVEE